MKREEWLEKESSSFSTSNRKKDAIHIFAVLKAKQTKQYFYYFHPLKKLCKQQIASKFTLRGKGWLCLGQGGAGTKYGF